MNPAVLTASVSLLLWLYLLLGRGGFWRERPLPAPADPAVFPAVAAVVPARDEAATVGAAVTSLLRQDYPGAFRIVLVDDHSADGTADLARSAAAACGAAGRLTVVTARPLPSGWTGKVWALAEGLRQVEGCAAPPEFVLFTDADIVHDRGNLRALVARAVAGRLDLVSLMVRLRCESAAERLLVPAFVFFFALLYPFAWVRSPRRRTAAAAGGCMLVRRAALTRMGGIACIRHALIDDCALAARIKAEGRIWLGLSDEARSLRHYPRSSDMWRLIARTAYAQLRHSPLWLVVTLAGMALTYVVPPVLTLRGGAPALPAGLAWLAMAVAFSPMLRAYGQPAVVAPVLPVIALFYMAATIDSARRHYLGQGGEWKGRVQQRGPVRASRRVRARQAPPPCGPASHRTDRDRV